MIEFDSIDISEEIDINKTNKSQECMLCNYWYFLGKNFSYQPYICNVSYNIMPKSINFQNIAIAYVKGRPYRIYFLCMSKRRAKSLMANSNLIDKKGVL